MSAPEILIPHAQVIARVTQVRSTLLQGSLHGLKRHDNYDAWLTLVNPAYRDTILESIAPGWLPVEVGLAHYEACDKLGLDERRLELIGSAVGERLQGTLMSLAAKVARNAGVTPIVAIQCFQRLWPRLFTGGSMQVSMSGQKDMTLEVRSAVLTRCRYFRGTFCGNVISATRLLGVRAAHAKVAKYDSAQDCMVVQLSWV